MCEHCGKTTYTLAGFSGLGLPPTTVAPPVVAAPQQAQPSRQYSPSAVGTPTTHSPYGREYQSYDPRADLPEPEPSSPVSQRGLGCGGWARCGGWQPGLWRAEWRGGEVGGGLLPFKSFFSWWDGGFPWLGHRL